MAGAKLPDMNAQKKADSRRLFSEKVLFTFSLQQLEQRLELQLEQQLELRQRLQPLLEQLGQRLLELQLEQRLFRHRQSKQVPTEQQREQSISFIIPLVNQVNKHNPI